MLLMTSKIYAVNVPIATIERTLNKTSLHDKLLCKKLVMESITKKAVLKFEQMEKDKKFNILRL